MSEAISTDRLRLMLTTAFGRTLGEALSDPTVTDILVNADGLLSVHFQDSRREHRPSQLTDAERERIVRLVASSVDRDIDRLHPIVSAELPGGARFEGLLPPLALGPCFAIRKHAARILRLEDYVATGDLTSEAAAVLREGVRHRKSLLIAGGAGAGKTTFANAMIAEMARTHDRLILLEDTRELQCAARDHLALRTSEHASLADLVRSALRLRPDRIIVGEVRGAEALDLLKAWNTGHPGGLATVHANSARAALYRLEQLIEEAAPRAPRHLIADAIDLVVFLAPPCQQARRHRRVETLARVEGLDEAGDYQLRPLLAVGSANPQPGEFL